MLEYSVPRRHDAAHPVPIEVAPAHLRSISEPATAKLGRAGDWQPVIDLLGLDDEAQRSIAARATINGTSFHIELLASGKVMESAFYEAVARVLSVEFLPVVHAAGLVMRDRDGIRALQAAGGVRSARMHGTAGDALILIAPNEADFARLQKLLAERPEFATRLRVVAPRELRRAIGERSQRLLGLRARHRLFDALPSCSARIVMQGRQGFVAGLLTALYVTLFVLAMSGATIAVHILSSFFFLACVLLRILAVRQVKPEVDPAIAAPLPQEMPRYSVLVALYKEADIVPELLVALSKLVWPRGKLEIKLVCEADDQDTIAAIRAQETRPLLEIIEVPKSEPRTKPKALAYASQMISGDLVALYDAEDRPHPLQLVEAWHRFRSAGPELACVQAPLVITNGQRSLIARMFAFEYSGLFRGVLPYLSSKELVLPLGGTSNHFRRDVLEKVGGWDPFNVTEDADLGLRLRRFGYRTETIALPTYEIGPETLEEWLPQRTRWFKGWIQTWLVHMRGPGRLWQELGWASFLVSQILFAGMVVSALVHPLMLVTVFYLAYVFLVGVTFEIFDAVLLGIDVTNIVLGYGAYLFLGRATLPARHRRHFFKIILFTPVYWMMLSWAAWRALWQLYRDPHLWEKTPHPVGRSSEDELA